MFDAFRHPLLVKFCELGFLTVLTCKMKEQLFIQIRVLYVGESLSRDYSL